MIREVFNDVMVFFFLFFFFPRGSCTSFWDVHFGKFGDKMFMYDTFVPDCDSCKGIYFLTVILQNMYQWVVFGVIVVDAFF